MVQFVYQSIYCGRLGFLLKGGFPNPIGNGLNFMRLSIPAGSTTMRSAIHAIGISAAETFTVSTVGKSTTSAIGANRKQIVVFAVWDVLT